MITVTGTDIEFACAPDQTVLEAAESAGWSIPYSCRRGVCTSCTGTLSGGTVRNRHGRETRGPTRDVLLCQAVPDGPVTVAPRRIVAAGPPSRRTLTTKVHHVHRPAPRVTVLQLRFPIGRRIPFRAGQYLEVHLPDGGTRPYSLANPPRDNDVAELHVRTEPGGRFSDRVAPSLAPGDRLTVEAPFGDTTVEPDGGPLLLLATGTGFAPARSLLLDQAIRRADRPVTLYWGARAESDLYLLAALSDWARRRPWLTVRPVLSRPGRNWWGATGRVHDVAAAENPDLSGHTVHACGNPAMVADARDLLTTRNGLSGDRFLADAFVPAATG